MNILRTIIALLSTFIGVQVCYGLVIPGYDASRHDRFLNFPSNPSHNPNFIHASLNLSGVGWYVIGNPAQRRGVTMISPRHFVGANHARPAIGATIHFLSTTGQLKTFTVGSHTNIPNTIGQNSDVLIGTLTTPITPNDNIAFHPYLNLNSESAYLNQTLVMLGRDALGGSQTAAGLGVIQVPPTILPTRSLRSVYDPGTAGADDAYFNNGDSGSPSFIVHGGHAAIVGIHSAVSSNGPEITNSDSFIPTYIDEINAVMEQSGYRITKAIPGSTTLSLTQNVITSPIRAGYPFTINVTLTNAGNTMGENIQLNHSFPNQVTILSTTGNAWFSENSTSSSNTRKASLSGLASSLQSISLQASASGTLQHQITYSCDQTEATTETFSINVIESFLSWSNGLTNATPAGDDDSDNINNLLEYAFGGDPEVSSTFFPNSSLQLMPQFSENASARHFSFIRRKDYIARAISYNFQSSQTMENASWSSASHLISSTTVISINSDFELVTYTLNTPADTRFFRIQITLEES